MTIIRHFEIIYILLDKKRVTAKELAEHFEVSTRTVYRDIDLLSGAGIPVYASKGRGGGISLLEGYALKASLFTREEQADILIGLQTLAVTDFPDTEKVLKKAAQLFKRDTSNWMDIDFSPWGSRKKEKQLFFSLRDSIIYQVKIRFTYFNSSGVKSERYAEPYQLQFKQNAWYLVGYCLEKEQFRIFKISRMRKVSVTKEPFVLKPMPEGVGEAEREIGKLSIPVSFQVSPEGAYRVYDEFDEDMISKNKDGSFLVKARLPDTPWLDSYLLSFGTLLEKVDSEEVRLRLLKKVDQIKNNLK
ncbi:helix-turn-helix transcriptional regulator [Planococcus sp. FY231025]|uniref:helix-turn-helix transcriptional regulator n=1 Tax=Planococcus sp. FY231025 TaxID=3455699 RepID=UPI003F915005